jgi:DNA-binding NarL/FixJ family response regulator
MSTTGALRVVVGDDSYLVREGIVRALQESGRAEVVGACADYDSLQETIEQTRPDVVVTDIRMPPTGTDEGIRLASELSRTHPEIGVVVLSQHAQIAYARALFEVASTRRAYILKERVADRTFLLDAVESVARERPMLDPQIAGMVLGPKITPGQGLDSLSAGEARVLALLADGASNSAIASKLDLTPRAVERRINAIFTKLGLHEDGAVNRRVLAVLAYVRNGA